MVSTRKKKKNKKRFYCPNTYIAVAVRTAGRGQVEQLFVFRPWKLLVPRHGGECTGGDQGRPPMMSRFRPGSQPRLEQLFCPVPMPTLPLVSMRTFSRTSCCFPARSRTIIRFPRPDPEQAPFVIGEKQPQTRKKPSPRPRKGPIQAPNPNKSTPIRPRAGPEHRLLPPHGVCGTILPYPAYLELYLVPHVR